VAAKPEVTEIIVVRPRINLVIDSEGRSNFAFAGDGDDVGGQSGGAASLPPIVIVDAVVTYLNERSGSAFVASSVDLTLSQAGLDGPLELTGAFNWNDQRSTVALYAKSPARLADDGSPVDFTITSPQLSAAFSGHAGLNEGLELAGTVDFTAHSLGRLLSWIGRTSSRTAGLPALTASGSLDLSGGAIRIKGGQIGFGRMNALGDMAVSFAGPKPRVTANLGVDRIDLGQLAGDISDSEPSSGPGVTTDWSEAPVDVGFLKIVDAELSLAASELAYGKLVAGQTRLDVGLVNGVLEAALVETELYGGSASGRLRLDGSRPLTSFTGSLKAEAIDGGKFVAGLMGPELIRGEADIELNLAAKGASPLELAAMLKGQAQLRFAKGALVDLDIPDMLARLATGDIDGWTSPGGLNTPFTKLEASFKVEDGIAETQDLSLIGPVAEVSGTGSIDVLRQRLDLEVQQRSVAREPDSDEPAGPQVPVVVVIEGSWSAPRIYRSASKLDLAPEGVKKEPSEAAVTR
jgi:AsmA protein